MKWAELLVPFFNVVYVIVAIVMIGLILMQRGAGAQAGSSFGAGASGTVFGARGSANFLSRSTSICAAIFFIISIGMGIYVSHGGRAKSSAPGGLMSEFATPAQTPGSELPAVKPVVPTRPIPASAIPVPASPAPASPTPASPAPASPVTLPAEGAIPATNVAPVTVPAATPPAELPAPVVATPAGTRPEK